ncbi:MAG TPA: hypothetical protein VF933_09545 [Streptosporangiaceae bacterium]
MRHLIGIALAIVMAVTLFFAAAWGYQWLLRSASLSMVPAGGGSLISDHRTLAAFITVAGTGLLAGILVAAPRISPLAAGLPGLLLLGWTALYVVSTRHAIDLIPLRAHVYGAGLEEMLRSGVVGAAGLAMIIPLFVPSRWRARRTPIPEVAEASEFFSGLAKGAGLQAPAEPASYPEQEDEAHQPRPAGPPSSLHHHG